MEPLGTKIRRLRRRLGLTLDDLANRTAISKPYLSLIETGRAPNPPSDEKLRRLEQALGFPPGELLTQAHLQRTPRDVRAVLQKLIEEGRARKEQAGEPASGAQPPGDAKPANASAAGGSSGDPFSAARAAAASPLSDSINLDDAYLSGVLQELVGTSANGKAGRILEMGGHAIPIINRVSAGYPKDFTDLGYPPRVADAYVGCPDLTDPDAFAARVHGDSMAPKYRQGDIVIFSPASPWREGNDCFVRFEDGQTTFKRVFAEKGDAGAAVLRLQPRNERYRPQVIAADQVSGLYKAVYQFRRVDED